MILVVALNPALDITYHVACADWAGVNRPRAVHARAGGKGLNVARTLAALGQPVTLIGLTGGLTGKALVDDLAGTGVEIAMTTIAGESRRTFAVVDAARGQTALFNEPGPAVTAGEYELFCVKNKERLTASAAVVLSGSLPPGVPADAYAGLIATAAGGGVPVVLDTSGAALRHGAAAGPALIKPNLAELEEVAGSPLADGDGGPDLAAVERAARGLMDPGTGTVVVSLGAHGLLASGPDGTWRVRPPERAADNPTGAGDAVVAGLAAGLAAGRDWPELLRHAGALGTAAAGAPVAGEFSGADYERLVPVMAVSQPATRSGWA